MKKAFKVFKPEGRNLTGAIKHSKATQVVRVKKIDTAVLMARICPNLAKNWMVVRHRGMDATTVVIAELRIAVPIWEMAAKLLQPRISWKKKEKKKGEAQIKNCIGEWRLGAWDTLELPQLLEANSKMETALKAGKTWQPSHELPCPKKTGNYHTDKQWKVEGGGWGKTAKGSTKNASSSCHTNKQAQPKACGLWHMQVYNKTTDGNMPQLLPVVNSVKFHLTSFNTCLIIIKVLVGCSSCKLYSIILINNSQKQNSVNSNIVGGLIVEHSMGSSHSELPTNQPSNQLDSPAKRPWAEQFFDPTLYSWFSLTWWDGHVGVQNNGKMLLKFCKIIESNSQKNVFTIVLYTNVAAVTSCEGRDVTWRPRIGRMFRYVCYNMLIYLSNNLY